MTKEEKLSYFENEINLIKEKDLQDFLKTAIENADDYVFVREASSSGKFHPLSDLGKEGLIRHIKCVFYIGYDLLQLEHYQQKFSPRDREIILVGLSLHDIKKYGSHEENRKHTINTHPILAAEWIRNNEVFEGIIPKEDRIKISNCIASHSGQWNTNRQGEEILPKPSNDMEFFVHLCDYIASRRYLDIDLTQIDSKIQKPIEPKDFVIDFGQKHNGRTIEEIYKIDKQYLLWAKENLKREPAHTYIKKFMEERK